jgi:4-amino-4-deoxy-L-arabinose transferase-like glycosyltransferase
MNTPSALNIRPWRGLWLLFAVLFIFLGSRGLNEPDEGRYAELGREMAVGGSWLVPHLNGFEHFQKPPLIYWCTAVSLKVLGHNEWAARMPSALAACGILLLTLAIARRLWSENRARIAAIVLVATLLFFGLARMLTPDMLMSFFITAAIAALVYERRWLFFVMMGLGFLTKGPMALVVPLSAALGAYLARDRSLPRVPFPWLRGMAIALLIGLSWFILLAVLDPPLFEYFWRFELLDRFASTKHGRSKPFWFFAPVLIGGLLPWTFWIPGLVRQAWHKIRTKQVSPTQGLLLGWTILPLIILSLSGSKLITYVLPLMPAFALAISGRFADIGCVKRVAVPSLVIFLIAAGLMPWGNPWMLQQAEVGSLVKTLQKQAHADTATIFASGVRAHGLEFYLGKLVSVTEKDADIVLPMNAEQLARVVKNGQNCAKLFKNRPAYGIVRAKKYQRDFAPLGWTLLDQSGDFVLTGNAELLAREPTNASHP